MDFVSLPAAREAERDAKAQRIAADRWLRVDESKITAPKDLMLLHRVRAAAADRSEAFDTLLRDRDVNRLLNGGALYFERPQDFDPTRHLWNWITDHATVLAAVISAISTGVVAYFTINLVRATGQQGKITGDALKLATSEFNATHRPEIVVHSAMEATGGMRENKTSIGASITYFNKEPLPLCPHNPLETQHPVARQYLAAASSAATCFAHRVWETLHFCCWSDVEHKRPKQGSRPTLVGGVGMEDIDICAPPIRCGSSMESMPSLIPRCERTS